MSEREPEDVGDATTVISDDPSTDRDLPAATVPAQTARLDDERYELEAEVARGGIGRVSRARDKKLARTVAVKQLLVNEPSLSRRFEREALITAQLAHPAIVPIYDIGHHPNGEPFYTMKLVAGRTLLEVIAGTSSYRERVALLPNVVAVADAVAYAHSRDVVHRDLKPANVLVGEFGETVVIDWGLAKRIGDEESERSVDVPLGDETAIGTVVGTPAYMSPEQAAGRGADQRSDVFALGALLYHVLAGAPPYGRRPAAELMAAIIASSPPPLVTRVPEAHPDLAAIVGKALESDPARRYPSGRELADDLRRFTTGQLVSAREYTSWQIFQRWIARHRLAVSVAAGALVLVAVIGALAIRQVLAERDVAETQRELADTARARSERQANDLRLAQARAVLPLDPTLAVAWLKTYDVELGSLADAREVLADARSRGVARWAIARQGGSRGTVVAYSRRLGLVTTGADGLEVVGWGGQTARRVPLPRVVLVATRDDGLVAVGTVDGVVGILDAPGDPPRLFRGHKRQVSSLAFGSGGSTLVSADMAGEVRRWDLATGASETWDLGDAPVNDVDTRGGWIAAAANDGDVYAWPTGVAPVKRASLADAAQGVLFVDDDHLAVAGYDGTLGVRTISTGEDRPLGRWGSSLLELARRSESELVTASTDGALVKWPLSGDGGPTVLARHDDLLLSLAVSAKGRVLAGTGTGALLVLETGEVRTLVGHAAPVNGVSFAGDDEVAVTSDELELRFWPIEVSGAEVIGERDRDGVFALAVLADGKTVVIGKRSGRLRRSTLDGRMEELGDEGEFVFLAASIGSPAWASGGTRLRVWGEGVSPLAEKPLGGELAGLAVSPDGRWVAAATSEPAVLLFGEKGDLRRPGLAGTRHLAWAPDSKRLAIAAENHVRVLHVETGAEIDLGGHQGTVFRVAWHPSGEWLATGALDRTARLWDTHGDSQILPHGALVAALVFTPRGRLVTSSWDQLVRAWEVDGSGPRTFPGHTGHIFDIAASPDGTHAATASRDGTARLWDLTSGSARVLRGHEGPVKRVAFADGGRILVTAGDDGTVRLWPVGVDEQAVDAVSFRRQLDALTTVVIDGEGRARTPAAVSR